MAGVAVGIDLGTSNSVACVYRNQQYELLPISAGNHLLPSVVEYRMQFVVGDAAKHVLTNPNYYVVANSKRVIGKKFDSDRVQKFTEICNVPMSRGPDGMVQFVDEANGEVVVRTPVSVATDILKDLIEKLRHFTERGIERLVVTVPADFMQEQRLATKKAIINAGIPEERFRILNEPTAASLCYCSLYPSVNQTFVVYDLGGGTFDCTVLQIENYHFRVLAHDGDENIGGVLFDKRICEYVIEKCIQQFGRSPLPPENSKQYRSKHRKLMKLCEEAKITLSVAPDTDISLIDFMNQLGVNDDDDDPTIRFREYDLFKLLEPDIQRTIDAMDRAIRAAKLNRDKISRVLYIGGSCHIKCVERMIREYYDRDIQCHEVHPDEAVAKGACIYSTMWMNSANGHDLALNGHPIFIEDITSVTLNIQVSPDLCYPFLLKGLPIDGTSRAVSFRDVNRLGSTTYSIWEGESENKVQGYYNSVNDCTKLKEYLIKYSPEDIGPNGVVYLFVFTIERDGVISLEIRNRDNNKVYIQKETVSF